MARMVWIHTSKRGNLFKLYTSNLFFYYVISALLGGTLGAAILKEGNPLTLHYVMFVPTIMGQVNCLDKPDL